MKDVARAHELNDLSAQMHDLLITLPTEAREADPDTVGLLRHVASAIGRLAEADELIAAAVYEQIPRIASAVANLRDVSEGDISKLGIVRVQIADVIPVLGAGVALLTGTEDAALEVEESVARVRSLLEDARESQQAVESIRETAEKAAGAIAAADLASYYAKLQDEHRNFAALWLKVVIGAMVVLVVGVVAGTYWSTTWPRPTTGWQFARDTTTHATLLFVPLFALLFAARSYRAEIHLQHVNATRRVGLQTYPLLIESVGSDQGDTVAQITAQVARLAFPTDASVPLGDDSSDIIGLARLVRR